MSQWSSAKAKRVIAALLRAGWSVKRESSSHKILSRPGWSDVVFAFHELLMSTSLYLEPDAPETDLKALLEHLIQWDIVYKLKYEHKVYDGPVFAGIEKFGFRGFPGKKDEDDEGIDEYFDRKVTELRSKHHGRLQLAP